jgi:hypothetical protein
MTYERVMVKTLGESSRKGSCLRNKNLIKSFGRLLALAVRDTVRAGKATPRLLPADLPGDSF